MRSFPCCCSTSVTGTISCGAGRSNSWPRPSSPAGFCSSLCCGRRRSHCDARPSRDSASLPCPCAAPMASPWSRCLRSGRPTRRHSNGAPTGTASREPRPACWSPASRPRRCSSPRTSSATNAPPGTRTPRAWCSRSGRRRSSSPWRSVRASPSLGAPSCFSPCWWSARPSCCSSSASALRLRPRASACSAFFASCARWCCSRSCWRGAAAVGPRRLASRAGMRFSPSPYSAPPSSRGSCARHDAGRQVCRRSSSWWHLRSCPPIPGRASRHATGWSEE